MKATEIGTPNERWTVDQLEEHKSMIEELKANHCPHPKALKIYQEKLDQIDRIVKRRKIHDLIGVYPHEPDTNG